MQIKNYEELNFTQIDVLREIGNIGSGNAATALSGVVNKRINMSVTDVKILDYNDAMDMVGGPELIVAGVIVKLSGDMEGIMLYLGKLEFINMVLESISLDPVESYDELSELELSSVTEIGNILISSYMNAIASLADINIKLSVPAIAVNMAGAILSVPMVEYSYTANKIMIIDANFMFDGKEICSDLILVPDINSLSFLLKKLGVADE
ncbi:chemotaxis protein CheC [Anaerovorax odorimutans]|uniref:chemotaxis protein CheC n=1 Tax=Anaerovorax odorimutans TaxID=109327 RepID=UPI00040F9299|nr:chemotaxis protein CheC [Anaerovorax odorimutans]